MKELPDNMTNGEKYFPALKITDPREAKEYLEALVARNMRMTGISRRAAEDVERGNIDYFACNSSDSARRWARYLYGGGPKPCECCDGEGVINCTCGDCQGTGKAPGAPPLRRRDRLPLMEGANESLTQ